jgi:hypothetical protein
MKGVIGNTWTMEYDVPDIDFTAANPITKSPSWKKSNQRCGRVCEEFSFFRVFFQLLRALTIQQALTAP